MAVVKALKSRCLSGVVTALALATVACSTGTSPTPPPAASDGERGRPPAVGQTPLAAVIKAAQEEGELNIVMGSMGPQGLWDEVSRLLEYKYGVRVRITYTSGPNFSQGASRIISEYKAGQAASTDATLMTPRLSYDATQEGALLEVNWLELDPSLPPALVNWANTGLWVAGVTGGIVYNTNLIRDADVPRTLDRMVDPKYRGMMVGTSTATQWPEVAIALGKERVNSTLEQMVQRGIFVGVMSGCGEYEPIAAGQFTMLTLYCAIFEAADYAKRTGAPLGTAFLDEVRWAAPYNWIIPKGSRHPNVGILVGLALASPEGQELLDKWQSRSSLYIPGTRMYNLIQESRDRSAKVVVSDWNAVANPEYYTLFLGETKEYWQQLLRTARK